jgi:hypothetical protein
MDGGPHLVVAILGAIGVAAGAIVLARLPALAFQKSS